VGGPAALATADVASTGTPDPAPGRRSRRTRPDAAPQDGDAGLGYRPGLDGLRALALLAVMAFHHGYRGFRGGYLGVSAFFTLSGFLIASLALGEWDRTGRLSWAAFWERRARRLLPAALVTLAGVIVLENLWPLGAGPRFHGDVAAALGYVTNWRLAGSGQGYADLFTSPSPLVHLWSLAIEEQFYLLFPLAFALVMVAARGRRRRGAVVVGLAAVASFATAWVLAGRDGNDGLTYYGTHTRAGELLVGVALAFALGTVRGRRALRAPRTRWLTSAAGALALAGMAWLWHAEAIGAPSLFRGVTALNALLTAVVVTAIAAAGPLDGALGVLPLRAIGLISYAAYLFHWPLFLLLAPPRVRLGTHAVFAIRVAATLAAAGISYVLVESPFRFRLRMPRPRLAAVMAAGGVAVVALTLVVPVHESPPAEANGLVGFRPASDVRVRRAIMPPAGRPPQATVLLAGDSVSWSMMVGFATWDRTVPDHAVRVDTHIAFGCPLGGPGTVRDVEVHTTFDDCTTWHPGLRRALARSDPDAVVMVMGLADLGGRYIAGRWRDLGDPRLDSWLSDRVEHVADVLDAQGAPVVWLTFPHIRARDPADPTRTWDTIPINDPARVDRLNEIIAVVAARHPNITVVDLAGWLDTWPAQSFDPADRDGVHFSWEASDRVAAWLMPQVLAAMDRAGVSERSE
jgi:peptidoglycan/LPS O-acetylase OafA/YrhL